MTIKELIEKLQSEDPNRLVVIQKDSEGNGYSPLHSVERAAYIPYNTWSGEAGLESLTPEDKEQRYTQEDISVDGLSALIMVPVN